MCEAAATKSCTLVAPTTPATMDRADVVMALMRLARMAQPSSVGVMMS